MIQWKVSAVSFALGALTTVGFVWLRRSVRLSRVAWSPNRPSIAGKTEEGSFDAEEAARVDALHDVGDAAAELELGEPMMLDPVEVQALDEDSFDRTAGGERYDAVDPEDVGAEFLQRATEAAIDSVPGSVPEPPAEPDFAAELPVGSVDAEGNTELHPSERPSGARAELSSTEEELENRRLAREEHEGSDKPHE